MEDVTRMREELKTKIELARQTSQKLMVEREQLASASEKVALERQLLASAQEKLALERELLAGGRELVASDKEKVALQREKVASELELLARERQLVAGEQERALMGKELIARERELAARERELVVLEREKLASERDRDSREREQKFAEGLFVPPSSGSGGTSNPKGKEKEESFDQKLLDSLDDVHETLKAILAKLSPAPILEPSNPLLRIYNMVPPVVLDKFYDILVGFIANYPASGAGDATGTPWILYSNISHHVLLS